MVKVYSQLLTVSEPGWDRRTHREVIIWKWIWTKLAQDRNKWRPVLNTEGAEFLEYMGDYQFLKTWATQLCCLYYNPGVETGHLDRRFYWPFWVPSGQCLGSKSDIPSRPPFKLTTCMFSTLSARGRGESPKFRMHNTSINLISCPSHTWGD
jgi:hypothetical protein